MRGGEGEGTGAGRVFQTQLAEVCDLLNREKARYVVVGARAMQLWGTTRATRDIDILIEPTVENAERVLRALRQMGFGLAGEWLAEEVANKFVTIIGDNPRVDIFTLAWQVRYPEVRAAAHVFEIEGVQIPTASIDHLIASKRTGRLQDAADIEILEAIRERHATQ